jgi:hypothetical protein
MKEKFHFKLILNLKIAQGTETEEVSELHQPLNFSRIINLVKLKNSEFHLLTLDLLWLCVGLLVTGRLCQNTQPQGLSSSLLGLSVNSKICILGRNGKKKLWTIKLRFFFFVCYFVL